MAHFQVPERGDGLQTWRVAENILNKQYGETTRGSPSTVAQGVELDGIFGTT
jgi:hypothetical protein